MNILSYLLNQRSILLIGALILNVHTSFTQDVIKTNNQIISCKITKIDSSTIYFKTKVRGKNTTTFLPLIDVVDYKINEPIREPKVYFSDTSNVDCKYNSSQFIVKPMVKFSSNKEKSGNKTYESSEVLFLPSFGIYYEENKEVFLMIGGGAASYTWEENKRNAKIFMAGVGFNYYWYPQTNKFNIYTGGMASLAIQNRTFNNYEGNSSLALLSFSIHSGAIYRVSQNFDVDLQLGILEYSVLTIDGEGYGQSRSEQSVSSIIGNQNMELSFRFRF